MRVGGRGEDLAHRARVWELGAHAMGEALAEPCQSPAGSGP
jgi:hypothetical protein